jgi:hypothetical protein
MKKLARAVAVTLMLIPLASMAQLGGFKIPGTGGGDSNSAGADTVAQNDALVRRYVQANKEVLTANSHMEEALGLKDAAAASAATAAALTEGATTGNLKDTDKAVSESTEAVASELAKGPKLDAESKKKYANGLAALGRSVVQYISMRQPAQGFAEGLKKASPMMLPKLQSGAFIVKELPGGVTRLATSLKNAVAFAKTNNIPVPDDATKALSAL